MMNIARRWRWWLPTLLLVVLVLRAAYRAVHPPWADTEAWRKYQQVRVGMREQEVYAILIDGVTRWETIGDEDGRGVPMRIHWRSKDGDHMTVDVVWWYDAVVAKSAVIQGHEFHDPPTEPSWWDRVRGWLGR
jgi:hypothetical protein